MLIFIGIITALIFAATVCGVFKWGEKEGICKYGYLTEEEEQNANIHN